MRFHNRSNRRLAHLSPHVIAHKVGCHYTGDVNVIDHGGTFYSLAEVDNGYVPCARFYGEHVDGLSFVDIGSVDLPSSFSDLFSALECSGWALDAEGITQEGQGDAYPDSALPHIVVDALISYQGIETDETVWYATSSDVSDNPDIVDDNREPILIDVRPSRRFPADRCVTENQLINWALRSSGVMPPK